MNELLLLNQPKLKLLLLVSLLQVLSFGAGLYSGHSFWPKTSSQVIQANYTMPANEPATATAAVDAPTTDPADCPIKGNISSQSKIYHVAGGAFYDRTQEEMCFATEAEAQAAGFVKSSR
jgi:hypothetical protein